MSRVSSAPEEKRNSENMFHFNSISFYLYFTFFCLYFFCVCDFRTHRLPRVLLPNSPLFSVLFVFILS